MGNEKTNECLLCGASAELKQKKYPGYQEPDTFEIFHCQTCNTAFSLPRIESTKIYEYIYKNGNKVPGYARYWEYARIVKELANPLEYLAGKEETYWGVKEALSLFIKDKKSTKILEIGSGLGYLTNSLIKANYNAIGLDISQTAVNQAIINFGDHYICADLFEYAELNAESFDVVILTEVIEHVFDPIDFIESIVKLLKPEGRAIITTPNKSLFPSEIIWATDYPPVHYWWFSEESMKYIANKLDININFIRYNNYYKNKYGYVNLKSFKDLNSLQPILNINGDLIVQTEKKWDLQKKILRKWISKIPLMKIIYRKSNELMNSDIIVCKDKGVVLCAIMQKKQI